MAETVEYRVKRPFKYGGRWYKSGELWQPGGARNDSSIIRQGLVATERVAPNDAPQDDGPQAAAAPEPQVAPPAVEAARSEKRMAQARQGAEPRPGSGGPA